MNAMLEHHGTTAYQQVNRFSGIEGASAHQLIEMLLKAALDKTAMAKGLMVRQEWPAKGEAINKSIAIVQELKASLNLEEGGSLAQNMDSLYDYIIQSLLTSNIDNDAARLDEVTLLLNEIYQSWIMIPEDIRR